MVWLFVIILAYLFFAISSLGDKIVISGKINPKSYTFYVGLLSGAPIILIPFIGLLIPEIKYFIWLILDAVFFSTGLYFGYTALKEFEVSKVGVTIGATQPIFIYFVSWIVWGYQPLGLISFIAFLFIFLGSILISLDAKPELTSRCLKITMFASLMYSFDYVLSKFIFNELGFLQGLIWRGIFIILTVLILLAVKENRKEIFKKENKLNKKNTASFFTTQAFGGTANFLQSFAIYLAPISVLPIVNSLRGMQYVFLFILTIFVSTFFPGIFKEKISKKIIFRKCIAIILIVFGLIFIVF